jgi:hypothetical protein
MELQTTNTEIQAPSYHMVNKDSMLSLSNELKRFVKDAHLVSNIKGKDYCNVEAWQMAGASLGLFPIITSVQDLSSEKEIKYMATCEVRSYQDNKLVSVGIAICSNKEGSKKFFDEYAILSMAQTRAVGKAFRNQLAWLMKAAGFEATPAEEMDFATVQTGASVHEEPKKTSKPVQEVVAEILQDEPTREEIMMEVAKCTKVKQLTDTYFTYKQSFDSDETLMKVLKMKKENLK